MNKAWIALVGLMIPGSSALAQVITDETLTPAQLVQNVLVGNGVTVTNISYNGIPSPPTPQAGSGSFNTIISNLGLSAGVLLTTGLVAGVGAAQSNFVSGNTGTGSDPDLVLLSGGTINDKAVLEFDFVPNGDTIQFHYVFGSEEYPEFVCSFNDAFGFFLSGPGIAGGLGYINDAENIAQIPGTNTPVTIDNVNNGYNNNPLDPNCPAVNPQYYVDNTGGTTVVYDGMTVVLECKHWVECGSTYHIKLAIGDALDAAYDSGVFLEAGSFTTSPFVPSLHPGPGIVGDTIYESCFPVEIDFVRLGDSSDVDTINMIISGTAVAGVDYFPPLPTQLVFQAYQLSIPFQTNAPVDPDSLETIIITLLSLSPCGGDTIESVFTFYIGSVPPLITIGSAHTLDCGDSTLLVPNITGGYGAFHYLWNPGGATTPTMWFKPTDLTDVTVLITDTCGFTGTAFFPVGLSPIPPLTLSVTGPTTMYEGCATTQVVAHRPPGNTADMPIVFTGAGNADFGLDYTITTPITINSGSNTASGLFTPTVDDWVEGDENAVIIGTYTNACNQSVSDTVSLIIQDPPPILLSLSGDTALHCKNDSLLITATASGGVGSLSYQWNTGSTYTSTWAQEHTDAYYVVTVTDDCGRTLSDSAHVNVICEIIVPNVISPNGDGKNDLFFIEGIEDSNNTVRIFNRWGQVVYEVNNYKNTWGGVGLPDGTYFYEVKLAEEADAHTGSLTILDNKHL